MRFRTNLLLLTLGICSLSADVKETIIHDIQTGNDLHLCTVLKKNVKKNISLNSLEGLARKNKFRGLYKEVKATRNTKLKNLGISKAQFIAISHYINTVADDETIHYPKAVTGLSHVIEYDRDTKKYFIVLEGKGVYIDRGMKKTVSKALCYDKSGAVVVARGEQSIEMERELSITKQFRGKPGLFKTLGICHHSEDGVDYHTIYSQLYEPGSLQNVLKNNYKLSFYEKVRIARDIALGLKTLHKEGIVHRDLGIKNYLINIPKGKPGKRKIETCIADFGRAQDPATITPNPRLQGNTTYMAPEGHFYKKMRKNSHAKLDVFAVGCVFYRLFYEKKGNWQDTNYVMRDPRPVRERHKEHKSLVVDGTAKRRKQLMNQANRTPKEEFEYLILQMLHTNPKKRVDAVEVHKRITKIYKKIA